MWQFKMMNFKNIFSIVFVKHIFMLKNHVKSKAGTLGRKSVQLQSSSKVLIAFMIIWGVFLFGLSISVLTDEGIIPQFLTSVMVLLSFPLSNKIKVIRKEKEQAEVIAKANHLSIKNLHRSDKLKDKKATILIADDEPIHLQAMQNRLMINGYHVITVSKSEEVLQQVKKGKIDLLIIDIMMPKMSAYEVCKRIRENFSLMELPILMLKARNQVENISTSFKVGANDYLTKPYNKEELLHRVETLIHLAQLNNEHLQMNDLLEEKVKKRTQTLQDMNIKLEKVNTDLVQLVDSRSQLLANIAHELGEPVTLIHSYAQSVQKGLIQPNQGKYLNMVFNKISVLDCLIHDLSDLSKLECGQIGLNIERIQLDRWIKQVLNKLEFEVNQSGRRFISPPLNSISGMDNFSTMIDPNRMDQVFSNLVCNAIKYTSLNSGEISMTISIEKSDSELIIGIHDNGNGIDEDRLPYIFERYHKGKVSPNHDKSEGTGLGLAIVKEIIKLHKARIQVVSQVNQGSSFSIALPIQHKK